MVISRLEVKSCLEEFLTPQDQTHIDLITDLTWMAALVLEFAFECPKEKREELREKFFKLIEMLIDAKTNAEIKVEEGQDDILSSIGLNSENIAVICDVSYELTNEKMPKEKILKWLKEAWDIGVWQQRIHSMEVEGGVLNETGTVLIFGVKLAMHGAQQGLLPN